MFLRSISRANLTSEIRDKKKVTLTSRDVELSPINRTTDHHMSRYHRSYQDKKNQKQILQYHLRNCDESLRYDHGFVMITFHEHGSDIVRSVNRVFLTCFRDGPHFSCTDRELNLQHVSHLFWQTKDMWSAVNRWSNRKLTCKKRKNIYVYI